MTRTFRLAKMLSEQEQGKVRRLVASYGPNYGIRLPAPNIMIVELPEGGDSIAFMISNELRQNGYL